MVIKPQYLIKVMPNTPEYSNQVKLIAKTYIQKASEDDKEITDQPALHKLGTLFVS